jgi:hypothetical protein
MGQGRHQPASLRLLTPNNGRPESRLMTRLVPMAGVVNVFDHASASAANTAGECTSPTRKSRASAYLTTMKNRGARNRRVSEVDLMRAEYLLSLHRRVERGWAGCMKSLEQIRDQVVGATEHALQWMFGRDGSSIPIPVPVIAGRLQLYRRRSRD